jgi:hypothetical protein
MPSLYTIKIYETDQNFTEKLEKIKKQFIKELKKKREYNGKKITYHSEKISYDAVFDKFIIGKPEYHQTNKVDIRRVQRLHWIHIILDYMIENNFFDPKGNIVVRKMGDGGYVILYEDKNYAIFFNMKKTEIFIGTAYVPEENRMLKLRDQELVLKI